MPALAIPTTNRGRRNWVKMFMTVDILMNVLMITMNKKIVSFIAMKTKARSAKLNRQ